MGELWHSSHALSRVATQLERFHDSNCSPARQNNSTAWKHQADRGTVNRHRRSAGCVHAVQPTAVEVEVGVGRRWRTEGEGE